MNYTSEPLAGIVLFKVMYVIFPQLQTTFNT